VSDASKVVRILLVDDVADLRRVVRGVLERHGGFVVAGEAGDGDEAVRIAAELQPELILLDLDMPGVTGLEALPSLREVVPAARIVVLSGLPRASWAVSAFSAGAVGFIEKGVRAHQLIGELVEIAGLLDVVERVLAERHVAVDQELTSPRLARRFVGDALRDWECDNSLDVVELLVSELVTNAVTHARSTADVAVVLRRDVVRIEVGDRSSDPPLPRQATPDARSGRGLDLVGRLASAWGFEPREGGKVVWFEVPRTDVRGEEVIA
jgi:DNA-binding NarL/FixJ family response regulator